MQPYPTPIKPLAFAGEKTGRFFHRSPDDRLDAILFRVGALLFSLSLLLALPQAAPAFKLEALKAAALGYSNKANPSVEELFRNALVDGDKHATEALDGTIYVNTGDIPAEWLRDSSAEVRPCLYFAKKDKATAEFLKKVIARQGRYINMDPYANAFTLDYGVWERKYELDSLCYPIILAWNYWKVTGDSSIFTNEEGLAFDRILQLFETEQHHQSQSSYRHKELANHGQGAPVADTGMIWSGFRPSDDATKYGYLIPAEMMAVVALGDLAEIERAVYRDEKKSAAISSMRRAVHEGIQKYGVVSQSKGGPIYAYEVDGLGHQLLTDDANVPNLLSIPYLGYGSDQLGGAVHQNTRRFILSRQCPTYSTGTVASGLGSYHTPAPKPSRDCRYWIWPLALVMQALTAHTSADRTSAMQFILASDPGDHHLHESFDPDNAKKLTRRDFAWPNALFAELILTTELSMPFIPLGDTSDLFTR